VCNTLSLHDALPILYSLLGEERFDEFLPDIERLYKVFTLGGEAHNLDVKFLFV
jgi:hypothetical protein